MRIGKLFLAFWLVIIDLVVNQLVVEPTLAGGRYFHFLSQPLGLLCAGALLFGLSSLLKENRFWLGKLLLWSGWLSNTLVYLFFQHIKDYIPTGISYLNLADLYIIIGLLALLSRFDFFHQSL